ncbi:glycosyltransferase family 4 protein [Vibrio sp. WXL103]|uniref:glycosyltransferase family 4 protein n=1 Tax=Vibrio sp. WXL103 TaxID=3450710 RepID=UPI003EC66B35
MKICHVNLASGYHGGENQTLALIKQQVSLGYDLTVVANPKSPFADAVRQLGVNLVLATHFTQSHSKQITQDCALIHVHEGRAIYWALIQHLLYGLPYLVTRRIDNRLKRKWLANLAYNKASAVVGLSSEIVRRIEEAYPTVTAHCIPSSPVSYPTDQNTVSALKQRFKDKFIVIHAANMVQHKGFDITINAARLLAEQNTNIHICLLGDGKERADLEAQAAGLANISFEGKQSNMGDWFAAADLQIHPSYTEGLGSVILEGMGAGLPVIATNTGGIPDIIEHDCNGVLLPPGSPEQLASAIQDLAQDGPRRERYIAQSKKTLERFDIHYTAQQYRDTYQSMI